MQSVIEIARSGTAVQGLFYNNNIECQHFHKKLEQSYKKGSLETVISTLQKLVERQENVEIKAIYGSGKRIRKQQETEVIVDRHAKRIRIEDPNCEPEIPFELFFRSLVPRLVEKCQGNCG